MDRMMKFSGCVISVCASKSGDLELVVACDSGTINFQLSSADASCFAASLNDFAARSAPVCDEAEG